MIEVYAHSVSDHLDPRFGKEYPGEHLIDLISYGI